MTQTFLTIAMGFVFGWGCAHYAARRGRNPRLWFIAGALFGIFALITLFLFSALKARKQQPVRPTQPAQPKLSALSPTHADKLWYYLDSEKNQLGPMSFPALTRAWNEGSVREQTYVWNEEMENWQYFKEVIEVQTGN